MAKENNEDGMTRNTVTTVGREVFVGRVRDQLADLRSNFGKEVGSATTTPKDTAYKPPAPKDRPDGY